MAIDYPWEGRGNRHSWVDHTIESVYCGYLRTRDLPSPRAPKVLRTGSDPAPSLTERQATAGMFRGPKGPPLVGHFWGRAQSPTSSPWAFPTLNCHCLQAAGLEAAAGWSAGLHSCLRVRGGPHTLRGAGATPAEPSRRLEAQGPTGSFLAPRGGRLPAFLDRKPIGPSKEKARWLALPQGPRNLTGPCLQHHCTQSLPGAAKKGGGGASPEGWACSWIYSHDTLCM